jgi:hypothetical protein
MGLEKAKKGCLGGGNGREGRMASRADLYPDAEP